MIFDVEKVFVTILSSVEHRATPALHQHIQVALFSADTSRLVLPGPLQLHTLPHHASRLSLCLKKKIYLLRGGCMFCLHVHHMQALRPAEGFRSPGTGITDVCEPPCECWESKLNPLEQPVLSPTEPLLQSLDCYFFELVLR